MQIYPYSEDASLYFYAPSLSFWKVSTFLYLVLSSQTKQNRKVTCHQPFFKPKIIKNKLISTGLSKTQIGLVVGSFDLANLCFSFVVASIVSPKNIKFFFTSGILWSAITVAAFGLLSDSPKGTPFFVSCLVTRIVNGIGASKLYSTALPIAVQMFPDKAGIATTIIQSSLGLGLVLGPPVGSALLPLGGYKTPFLTVSTIEFVVFVLALIFVPSKGAKAKSKVKGSDYINFLIYLPTLSTVVPAAGIFCLAGVRDTAYALYFEETLGLDSEAIGYIFLASAIAYFLTGPVMGVLVELGMGTFASLIAQLTAPIFVLGFYLPKLVPALEVVPWGLTIMFFNGFSLATLMNPSYLVLEKSAIRKGYSNMQQIKTLVASSFNLTAASGRTIGAFVIGGYLNDHIGFYNMCLCYGILLVLLATWHVTFLFKFGLVKRTYYDTAVEFKPGDKVAQKDNIGLSATTDSVQAFDVRSGDVSIKSLLMSSMNRRDLIRQ